MYDFSLINDYINGNKLSIFFCRPGYFFLNKAFWIE